MLWVCVRSLSYPACNAHALYRVCSHYLINTTFSGKIFLKVKCVSTLQLVSETFLIPRRNERDITSVHRSSCNELICIVRLLMKIKFSPTDFRKIIEYQIPWKYVLWGSRCSMQTDRQTDGHDKVNTRPSQFCERSCKVHQRWTDL